MRLARTAPPAPASPVRALAPTRRRRGAAVVEMAFVLPIFLMFLFGIFEYARFLMMHQVLHNAARDAARWAVVRSSAPEGTIFTVDNGSRLAFEAPVDATRPMYNVPFIEARLYSQTVGIERNLTNMSVRVYVTDPATLYTDPPQIRPKSSTTTWNQGIFSERLAVQVVGTYSMFTPGILVFGTTNVNIIAMMGIES